LCFDKSGTRTVRNTRERKMPQFTSLLFIGHAGFLLRHKGVSLLCDPWVSEGGAFLHSWHQFPPNDFLDKRALFDADYLYISHSHEDHFDKEFLTAFPKSKVTVVIADFLSDSFANEISALGFARIVRLKDGEVYELANDFKVSVFKDQSLYKVDSSILIEAGPTVILDSNDCHIAEEYYPRFKDRGIDILFKQFSGAMWFPAAYGYPEAKEKQVSAGIRKSLLDGFTMLAEGVGAKHVVHCAGPPCFLDEDSFRLNFGENNIFPDQHDVFSDLSQRLSGKLHLLLPGDGIQVEGSGELKIVSRSGLDFRFKKKLLIEYQKKRAPLIKAYLNHLPRPEEGFVLKFADYIQSLLSSSDQMRRKIDALVKFTLTGANGGSVYVDTRKQSFSVSQSSSDSPNYHFTLATPIAKQLVEGIIDWETVLLSLRFSARRQPDQYNWPLFALLRYGQEPKLLAEIERIMKESEFQTISVQDGNRKYRIQRYCPHAGEDLSYATLENGRLTCSRHRWSFDLRAGGACVAGGNIPLRICEESCEDELSEEEVSGHV
jgi:UDP-MurNAc hydroxylase